MHGFAVLPSTRKADPPGRRRLGIGQRSPRTLQGRLAALRKRQGTKTRARAELDACRNRDRKARARRKTDWKDLRAPGEQAQRLYGLDAWKESPYYTGRERAALAWAEAVTNIQVGRVPDVIYDEARTHFTEKELADLTLAVATINAWNRLSIAARTVPGTSQPAEAHGVKREG